ncbi:MAG TPA: MOSC domain-containing protein, partial [Rhizobiales bacterium]|nr:MOSC domain-containing protein [Hyphomicrobiales bacterium]
MSQPDTPFLDSIYRYPVKGLSPQALEQAELEPGRTIAFDRA